MKYSDSLRRAATRRTDVSTETWADERFAAQRDRDLADHTIDASRAIRALGVCVVVAALLSSGRLVTIAEGRPFGPTRDIMVEVANGIDRVANFLSLNVPADVISDMRGGTDAGRSGDNLDVLASQFETAREGADASRDEPVVTVTTAVPTSTAAPVVASSTTVEVPVTTTTVPAEPTRRQLFVEDPLRTVVIGDSQAEIVGQSLIETARNRGRYLDVVVEAEVATGLARPDDFNWPAQLLDLQQEYDAELVLIMLGGNDDWDMEVDGERVDQGEPGWQEEYRFRVSLLTDIATQNGAHAVWVLYPPIRDGARDSTIDATNAAIVDAVAGRDDTTVLDAHSLFANSSGGYEVFLENDLGATRRMRADDGVHFTRSGSNWLSREIYDLLSTIWIIPES